MRKMVLGLLIAVLGPAAALAQTPDEHKGQGYVYFAPAVATFEGDFGAAMAHVGAGGEGFFTKNLGAGVDVGYLTPMRSWGDGIGTFSPNFVARFLPKTSENKVEPFLTGGYTLFFRSGTGQGFNFGGGLNYWFKDRIGLRFEVRDNVGVQTALGFEVTQHFVGFRIGLAFR